MTTLTFSQWSVPGWLAVPVLAVLLGAGGSARAQTPLQPLLDATPPGGTLLLAVGTYAGPVHIAQPLTLRGEPGAVVDAGGTGTVIVITADGVTVEGLEITGSGESHDQVNAGIRLESSHNRIVGNRIHNALFGIDLKSASDNLIEGNDIQSMPVDLGVRGDGMRLWDSHRNIVRGNRIHDSRDLVVWYSRGNLIEHNQGWNNRYSLHFMYASGNLVRFNTYRHAAVGIFIMYSDQITIIGNEVFNSLGSTGMGVGMKDSSAVTLIGNRIVYCATGIYVDQSPFDEETVNRYEDNDLAYNVQAVKFHSDWEGNEFRRNRFVDNLHAVAVAGRGTALNNIFAHNYWSSYEGFDRDRDGVGDLPFQQRAYSDLLWMDFPAVKFFYGSPVMSFLDFLARLAPLSEPRLIVEDPAPLDRPPPGLSPEAMAALPEQELLQTLSGAAQ